MRLLRRCFVTVVVFPSFNRDWRYHKEERVWITRAPGMEPTLKTNAYERGTYYFFDCLNWRKVAKVNTNTYSQFTSPDRQLSLFVNHLFRNSVYQMKSFLVLMWRIVSLSSEFVQLLTENVFIRSFDLRKFR